MKTCTVCKELLPLTEYHKSKASKDGYGYRCRSCDKKAREEYRDRNKERFAEVSRRKQLKHRYGITLEEYENMLNKQGGCCAICGSEENNTRGKRRGWNFAVDHCHTTGAVRGLLCNNCNRGLGLLGDTQEGLNRALNYLRRNDDT